MTDLYDQLADAIERIQDPKTRTLLAEARTRIAELEAEIDRRDDETFRELHDRLIGVCERVTDVQRTPEVIAEAVTLEMETLREERDEARETLASMGRKIQGLENYLGRLREEVQT